MELTITWHHFFLFLKGAMTICCCFFWSVCSWDWSVNCYVRYYLYICQLELITFILFKALLNHWYLWTITFFILYLIVANTDSACVTVLVKWQLSGNYQYKKFETYRNKIFRKGHHNLPPLQIVDHNSNAECLLTSP